MAGSGKGRYPPEYRERMVELARAERSPASLAREFDSSAQTIRNWVRSQADLDEGRRSDGLTWATGLAPSGPSRHRSS